MRPPTSNAVSQGKHGTYNAVDYRAVPDDGIYAPEDLTFVAYFNNGNAGMQLQAMGANGRHGFAHTSANLMGATAKKGQLIARMGYTGLTIPSGPAGKHLHWTIRRADGSYPYPPSLVTEPFNQGGTQVVLTEENVKSLYRRLFKREGDVGGIKNYTGKQLDSALADMVGSQEFKAINTINNTVTIEKPVEVIKEVVVEKIVEVPVEVIKEVQVVVEKPVPQADLSMGQLFEALVKKITGR